MNKELFEVSISAFAARKESFIKDIQIIQKSGADRIHFDIMDSKFVPANGLNFDDILKIKEISNLPIDIHLMCVNNRYYIDKLYNLPIDSIIFHIESEKKYNILPLLRRIKKYKICGLALSPESELNDLIDYLDFVDEILILSSQPGQSNGFFIFETLTKIKEIEKILTKKRKDFIISVDGSIKIEYIEELLISGVNKIVIGREFFNQIDKTEFIYKIRGISRKYFEKEKEHSIF